MLHLSENQLHCNQEVLAVMVDQQLIAASIPCAVIVFRIQGVRNESESEIAGGSESG